MISKDAYFDSRDGIHQNDPDSYWHYRFNLMLDATSAIQGFLELLMDYNQKRKLTQFLLYFCDQLEITFDRHTGTIQEYRFQVDFSDRISLQYSSRAEECYVFLDGEKDYLPTLSPEFISVLNQFLAQIWNEIRTLPIWETVTEDTHILRVTRSTPQYPISLRYVE